MYVASCVTYMKTYPKVQNHRIAASRALAPGVEALESRTLLTAVTLLSPSGETGDTTPTFEWTAAANVKRYDLLVRDLATGERVIRESSLPTTSFTPATPLPFGNYRAYVRVFFLDNTKSDWESSAFSIEGPPTLSVLGEPGSATPTFDWTTVEGAERYDLLVRNIDTGEKTIREQNLTDTSFTPDTPLAGGSYRAYIRAHFADGSKTDWDSVALDVDGPPMLSLAGEVDEATPIFTWTMLADVERYDLMIRNIETGERPVRESQLTTTMFTPDTALPDGIYRAYVRAFFNDGSKTDWDSVAFSVRRPPSLSVTDPNSSTPIFDWSAVVGASRYDLLVKNSSGDELIRERQLMTTSFTPAVPLADGDYIAQIRAYFDDGSKTVWDAIAFSIDSSLASSLLVLSSSADQEQLNTVFSDESLLETLIVG